VTAVTRRLATASVAALLAVAGAQPAAAMVDHGGTQIDNTATSGTQAQLASGPTVTKKLFTPESPGDDDPTVLAALGSSATPEDDLGAALDALRDASSVTDAQDARRRALDILEGNSVPDRTYSGMPLLNWDAPSKVKDVPPGGDVRVKEVRYGDTVLSDTWMLRFADPAKPFTITYVVADLGPSSPGELAPTPLLADGNGPIGGLHSVLQPLALDPMLTGTSTTSRFTDQLGEPQGGKEQTRQGVQEITVRMPPPRYVEALLNPDLTAAGDPMSAGGNPMSALRPFDSAALSTAQGDAGISKIGAKAPERELYDDLTGLNPANLGIAHQVGGDDRGLVSAMRTHTQLPPGFSGDPAADASMVLLNNETYRSADRVHLAPGGSVTVSVTNGDNFTRTISARQLFGSQPVLGAVDWGQFDWSSVDLGGAATFAPGQSHTFTITPENDAFELIIGDGAHGDTGTWALGLDRGPVKQSMEFADNSTTPLHITQGPDGDMWMTLAGIDSIGRVKPGADISTANVEKFLIPGGNHSGDPAVDGLGPHALRFDANGILWATLDLGNGIARIDPSKVKDGTEDGVRVYHLNDCGPAVCPAPFPPEPGVTPPPTRMPVQLELKQDGDGNTVLVFAEQNAKAIGVARFAPDGTMLDDSDFSCGCAVPLGLGLGADGSAWFTEAVENRIGHLSFDQTEPFKTSAGHLEHFNIPTGVAMEDPALVPGGKTFVSSAPHSLAVDRRGRVWFSEEATGKIGVLDPDHAAPGTTNGMQEFALQTNDFGRRPAPADVTVDRKGTLFWTDEYGDAVGSMTLDGTQHQWRPSDRNSLTDSPTTDTDGNLWFLEGGANLMTRISGITAGSPLPDGPPTFTVRTATGTVSATGIHETRSMDVQVLRDGRVVDDRTVDTADGTFTAGLGARAGDTVRVLPQGDFVAAAFSFVVPTLDGALGADGTVAGRATRNGQAIADQVSIGGRDASISPADGAFSLGGVGAGAGDLTWGEGTPAGIFRTVTPYSVPAGGGAPPSGGGTPKTTPPAKSKGTGKAKAPNACRDRLWLVRTGTIRSVPLLGATSKAVRSCLGAPTSRTTLGREQRWRYGKALELRFRSGKVTRMILGAKGFRSTPDGLGVGAASKTVGAAFGAKVAAVGRVYLRRGDGKFADVRVAVRRGKVARITVDLRARKAAS
jgi:streptogramin lyase